MADAESIKRAFAALEERMAWADNVGRCFVLAAADETSTPSWVDHYCKTVADIGHRVEQLGAAIHGVRP